MRSLPRYNLRTHPHPLPEADLRPSLGRCSYNSPSSDFSSIAARLLIIRIEMMTANISRCSKGMANTQNQGVITDMIDQLIGLDILIDKVISDPGRPVGIKLP